MRISKTLELSTAHISYATSLAMDHGDYRIARYGYGYLVYADPWQIKHRDESEYQSDLLDCIALAIEHNCTYILFDCDEEPIEELPIYEW